MNRLARLDDMRREGKKALSLYLTAGYPTLKSTLPLILGLEQAGADLFELGMPFSDPIADGPTIQMSSEAALRNGITVGKTLSIAAEVRKRTDVPMVFMGYANPLYAYGLERFFAESLRAGIDGVIIPDMPLEESAEYLELASEHAINPIFLAAPTTPDDRIKELDSVSKGFLYCISVTGVTGARESLAGQAESFLVRMRAVVRLNPVLVGFGVGSAGDAGKLAKHSDGVIIGSALVRVLADGAPAGAVERAVKFIGPIRDALDRIN